MSRASIADVDLEIDSGLGDLAEYIVIVSHQKILDRFPYQDKPACPLPPEIALFCENHSETITEPNFHAFATTIANGDRLYGYVLVFQEEQERKALCIVSRWMFLREFRTYLIHLYKCSLRANDLPIERYIANLIYDAPCPPFGAFRVNLQVGDTQVVFERPPSNDPLLFTNFPFYLVFAFLDAEHIVRIFEYLIMERQVLLVSQQQSLLTIVAESLLSLLFPFEWQHIYIPFLPQSLLDFLNAPVPYFIGTTSIKDLRDLPPQILVVDLDNHTISSKKPCLDEIPKREKTKLLNVLKPLADWRKIVLKEDLKLNQLDFAFSYSYLPEAPSAEKLEMKKPLSEESIHQAFLRVFVSLLRDYKDYLTSDTKSDCNGYRPIFDFDSFIAAHPTSGFLSTFVASVAFQRFLEDRFMDKQASKILYFDEVIIAKLNRSILVKAKPTPFLDDHKHKNYKIIDARLPDKRNLPKSSFEYEIFPSFKKELFGEISYAQKKRSVKIHQATRSQNPRFSSSLSFKRDGLLRKDSSIPEHAAVSLVFFIWFKVFCSIISYSKLSNYLSDAFNVLRRMMTCEIIPDQEVFRDLIETCGKCKAPDQALRVIHAMKEFGVVADPATYSSLLRVFAENGDVKRAYGALGHIDSGFLDSKEEADPALESDSADAYGGVIHLKACIMQFEKSYPGYTINLPPCQICTQHIDDLVIRQSWTMSTKDSSIDCLHCQNKFSPQLEVRPIATFNEDTAVICAYLSPPHLLQEMDDFFSENEAAQLLTEEFRIEHPSMFWNLIWHFSNIRLPIAIVAPAIEEQGRRSKVRKASLSISKTAKTP